MRTVCLQGMMNVKDSLLKAAGPRTLSVSSKGTAPGTKVATFGMGGIGKTVMAAWVARDTDVRRHFEVVLWLTLSQTPHIPKLQVSS